MSEKIDIGDVVYLKSGSPGMTVYTIGADGDPAKIGTTFFLGNGASQNATYPVRCLTKERVVVQSFADDTPASYALKS